MSKGKPRDARKEQFWRRVVRRWHSSGLSVRNFCRQQNLSEPSFYAWRRLLQQREAATALFVPVRLLDETSPSNENVIELVLTGQRTVRVRPGFDATTLQQLLDLLQERPC